MRLDIDKLSKYDLTNAKVGDKVVITEQYNDSRWYVEEATIKSVSPKRGDITFNDRCGTRVDKYGRKIGADKWDTKYYTYLEHTQENIVIINGYLRAISKARGIILLFREIEKQGFKMLYDLPEDKVDILHKTMKEVFSSKFIEKEGN